MIYDRRRRKKRGYVGYGMGGIASSSNSGSVGGQWDSPVCYSMEESMYIYV